MNSKYEGLKNLCAEFFEITDEMVKRFDRYAQLLIEWNSKMNLTAIIEPEEILIKHFYDCLLFLKNVEIPQNARVIDVGTGAGFPGMVLKIAHPDIELTLLDSLNKRLTFLSAVAKELDLKVETLHLRAEDAGKKPEYREKFDISTARAVARLNVLSEYCIPFLKVGGQFVAMKGPAVGEELSEVSPAIHKLGGKISTEKTENLPDGSQRAFVIIKKISQTPTIFPRISAKIAKKPL